MTDWHLPHDKNLIQVILLVFSHLCTQRLYTAGVDPGFFLGGGAPHTFLFFVLFFRIPVVLEGHRSFPGGVHTPCILPIDPPFHRLSYNIPYFVIGKLFSVSGTKSHKV